jgi:mannose-6-phosphate isomerase-like protein (cupin superfamily)
MMNTPIDLSAALEGIDALWRPLTVATLNDYDIRLARIQGEFAWHTHPETDEVFLVIDGKLTLQLRDGDVELSPGQLYVVPKGVEHCPRADAECHIMMVEPSATVNTGDLPPSELTAPRVVG